MQTQEQTQMSNIDAQKIFKEIYDHSIKIGRDPKKIKILAVSKLQPVEKLIALHQETGHRFFAENYVQEALEKQSALKQFSIEWHLIGHVQRKKINSILGKFEYIHSIDSLLLAQTLSEKCLNQKILQKIFLEVNLSQEKSKEGWTEVDLLRDWAELRSLKGIKIVGLMTMPPQIEDPEKVRPYFKGLREFMEKLNKIAEEQLLVELSMGTSQDYLVALEEGATFVRIGSKLFGERLKK